MSGIELEAPALRDPSGASRIALGFMVMLTVVWLAQLFQLSRSREFAPTELRYMTATVLVASDRLPYREFHDDQPLLSYVIHAPLVGFARSLGFREGALVFRAVMFVYLVLTALVLLAHAFAYTRSWLLSLIGATLPLGLGYGLLSAIEYRPEVLGALAAFIGSVLLDLNRRRGGAGLAFSSGLLLVASIFMSRELVFLVAPAAIVLLVSDLNDRLFHPQRNARTIARPLYWLFGATVPVAAVFGFVLWTGIAPAMFEAVVREAAWHERFIATVHFAEPLRGFLSATLVSSAIIGLLAIYFLVETGDRLWTVLCFGWLAATFLTKAQLPVYFVYPCLAVGLCATRGLHELVRRVARARPGVEGVLSAVLVLVVATVLWDQMAFTSGRALNSTQLQRLDTLEALASPGDRVIDGSGSSVFLAPAAHRYWFEPSRSRAFPDYFERQLLAEYRASEARFYVDDGALAEAPASVRDYLRQNFVRVSGDVYARRAQPSSDLEAGAAEGVAP